MTRSGFRIPTGTRPGSKAWLITIALILSVVAVTALPYLLTLDDVKRVPYEQAPVTLELPDGMTLDDLQKVTVEDVIDGDTLDVLINNRPYRVRFYGVDTPERGTACYRAAMDRNYTLSGDTVYLLPDARDRDEFGRLLRYVFNEDGVSVDATLVAEGFGEAWRSDGRYRNQIVDLEQQARESGRGCLWASEAD